MSRRPPTATKAAPSTVDPADRTGPTLSWGPLDQVMGYLLAQASVATTRVFEAAVGQPTGLHRLEYTLLVLIGENPGCTASALSKALAISPPNMVVWLDRLSSQGLVEREPSETDRRANHLRLTVDGQALAARTTRALRDGESAMLAALSPGERAILAELLAKLARSPAAPARAAGAGQ